MLSLVPVGNDKFLLSMPPSQAGTCTLLCLLCELKIHRGQVSVVAIRNIMQSAELKLSR